jgi:hypothetical protein
MPEPKDEPEPVDPTQAAWDELPPFERALIVQCGDPGYHTEGFARARETMRGFLKQKKGGTAPPPWWSSRWRP